MDALTFADAAAWEAWLAANYEQPDGAWLRIAKKGSGATTVTITDALDVALCYGWIDGQRKALDQTYYLQRYTRRRPRSTWSQVNVDKVDALIAAGRMREPGFAQIRAAQEDGRWDAAYVSQRNVTVPPDLAAALAASEPAKAYFDSLGKTDRYLVIMRLLQARTPDGRLARLRTMVGKLEAGERVT
jgi:uncharacterized protein YdeI (YjbR/CyaY-like superfamily)